MLSESASTRPIGESGMNAFNVIEANSDSSRQRKIGKEPNLKLYQ